MDPVFHCIHARQLAVGRIQVFLHGFARKISTKHVFGAFPRRRGEQDSAAISENFAMHFTQIAIKSQNGSDSQIRSSFPLKSTLPRISCIYLRLKMNLDS